MAYPPTATPCTPAHPPAAHARTQELPASVGQLQRLRLLQLDGNAISSVPPAVLLGCMALETISLHDNPITPDQLQATQGFAAYEARRRGKYSKTLAAGVLLSSGGMDEGVDRQITPRQQPSPRL